MEIYYDDKRHLVCIPYSVQNLHRMAEDLGIRKCWFHKNHYDIPKKMLTFVSGKAKKVSPKEIFKIIKGGLETVILS